MMRPCTLGAILLLALPAFAQLPSDQAIRAILGERAGEEHGVGIVVGIISPKGRRIVSTGGFNGETAFEIGSLTKVFTGMLLADMARRGEVAMNDPAARYLPASVRMPVRSGRAITLADLATHTSGLPFMSDELILESDPGTTWNYSNLGYRLLGQALSARAGMPLEELLRARITGPLRMTHTGRTAPNMATGFDASLQPAPRILSTVQYKDMFAAGGLVSTAGDLLTFLGSAMSDPRTQLMLATRRPKSAGVEQALGWLVIDDSLVFHDGGTLGFASAIAWDKSTRTGVVVLMNRVGDVADIAQHLLRPSIALRKTQHDAPRKEIAVGIATLDRYAGRYEADGEGVFIVCREGDSLTFEAPADWGLPKLRIHAESERDFFARELPLRVSFEPGGGMLIRPPRGQKTIKARSIPGSCAP